jgi:hypothetical protein
MSTLYIVQIWDQEESKGHFAVCNTHLQIMHNTWILFQFTSKTGIQGTRNDTYLAN